ncbi:MAG TPA: hypothetical protein VEB19_03585 [Gemmatimonadaceae bacterium]|nr:hypothetical protein [Gemmatimonadaceae bacterium]
MRTSMKLSLASLLFAAGATACGDAKATEVGSELARDLELASSTVALATPKVDSSLLGSMETKPQGAPEQAPVVKKGAGPRAVRSQTPTVRATPVMEVAAADEAEEEVEVMDIAPAPEESNEPVAIAPRPQPVVVQTGGAGDYGTGSGGVYGGGVGVVIRGGGVHGDNCELHRGGRTRGPIFVPATTIPRTGGTVVNIPSPRSTGTSIGSRNPGVGSARERGSITSGASSRVGSARDVIRGARGR